MGWLDTAIGIGENALKDNAGSIAAGVTGAILGSGTNKGAGSTTTSVSSIPSWMSDYAQQLLTQANAVASRPYQQYTGPRVADLTPDQQAAGDLVRGNAGQAGTVIQNAMGGIDPNAGKGYLAQAGDYMNAAGGNWLDNSGNYMADYQKNVTNPAVDQAMRTWSQQINPSIQADFSGSKGVGAYGSSAMLNALAGAGTNLSGVLGNNMAAYLQQGYSGGENQFNTQNQQKGQLAQIASGLGTTEQNMGFNNANTVAGLAGKWAGANQADANALNAVGTQEQGVNQSKMNVDYSNFLEAQGYDKNQIAYLQSILNGNAGVVPKTTTGTTAGSTYTSPLQAATQGYSLYNAMTSGNNNQNGIQNPGVPSNPGISGYNDPFNTTTDQYGMPTIQPIIDNSVPPP